MRDTRRPIDWRRVLEDIVHLGLTGEALGARVGVRVGLLQCFAKGTQRPASLAADRIAALWCDLTSKAPEFLPRQIAEASHGHEELVGLDAEGREEPTFAQLQEIQMVWRESTAERVRSGAVTTSPAASARCVRRGGPPKRAGTCAGWTTAR